MTKHEKKELKRYRKLGTIEELSHIVEYYKRELYNLQQSQENRHKQEAKKPYIYNLFCRDNETEWKPMRSSETKITFHRADQYYTCPTCNLWLMEKSKLFGNRSNAPASCSRCGQKLDWSNIMAKRMIL